MMQAAASKLFLLDSIFDTCRHFPEKELFNSYTGTGLGITLTGNTLMDQVKLLGSFLQHKMAVQERVILLLPQDTDYIIGLIACFYANVIVVPVGVAADMNTHEWYEKIKAVIADSNAAYVLTNDVLNDFIALNKDSLSVSWLNINEILVGEVSIEQAKVPAADDLAMLLYTSGSTAQPKGVILGHDNLYGQVVAGAKQWAFTEESCIVTWMPQFHSFGLAFNILSPLITGASSVIMPADSFIKHPEHWFMRITEFHATHTAAPNFAFDYCCSAIDPELLKDISLSSLTAIICGGESVRKETWDQFYDQFKAYGLHENVFCPHYGSSETGAVATVTPGTQNNFISLSIAGLSNGKIEYTIHEQKRKFVASCGTIGEGITVLAVDQQTSAPCKLGETGEIWVKSSGVGRGYLTLPEETEHTFYGTVDPGRIHGFLRTGDIGFVADNQLYIVGRQKEVIIIHGKNHHPADIEWTVKKYLPQLTLPVAVFSCEIGLQEKAVLIQEIEAGLMEGDYQQIIRDIISAISAVNALEIYDINLVSKGNISRTGSGKVSRKMAKKAYLEDKLNVLYQYKSNLRNVEDHIVYQAVTVDTTILSSLRSLFLSVLKLDANSLHAARAWSELGLNSIQYVQVAKKIEEVFNLPFTPAMLFKYRTFEKLADFLDPEVSAGNRHEELLKAEEHNSSGNSGEEDIAIIGLHCQFPGGAADADLFWANMVQQKDGITAIPEDRPLDNIKTKAHQIHDFPEWGGFIDKAQLFDADFFGISPLEAESMDPQQRKALELTWKVIEDSGYNPHDLSGQPVGVFFGVHNNDYAELIIKQPSLTATYGALLDSGLHMSMITHRVSRWFNFQGPSEVINTACSSSLVAVHHAVKAISRGECTIAVAGGINLILSSRVYKASHQAGMLAADGHCKTFDAKADGFVRAEGLGAVLLKSLKQAQKDNDIIYGVIKGIAVNHDGKSNSLRAPNLNAQRQVIASAYRKSGISPETVSFIEAHGTGTSLGDPIEFQALQEAFEELSPNLKTAFCGLGTVKTNIGHSESAAGIAGMIKVLMAMKHESLPGILHFEKINPFIRLEKSPFYIVSENQEWKRLINAEGKEIPRRAGVSSFGFGGANVHIILEQYTPLKDDGVPDLVNNQDRLVIIPLSAKNKERLKETVYQLLGFLKRSLSSPTEAWHAEQHVLLINLAYTLQTGREAMEERVTFLVSNIFELIQKLEAYTRGGEKIAHSWSGRILSGQDENPFLEQDDDSIALIYNWFLKGKLDSIARIWTQGATILWKTFYENNKARKISLPTYPFAETRYWITPQNTSLSAASDTKAIQYLHPLLHQNTSSLSSQQFTTIFTGTEFFLKDHIVQGKSVLPAVAYLEMVREAVTRSSRILKDEGLQVVMKNVVWIRPLVIVENTLPVHISLYPGQSDEIEFEIYSNTGSETLLYSQGTVLLDVAVAVAPLAIDLLRDACAQVLTTDQLYTGFSNAGMVYGHAFRGVEAVYIGEKQLLAKIILPSSVIENSEVYKLHPSILDAALQAASGLGANAPVRVSDVLTLPFALQELVIISPCTDKMWAWVRYAEQQPAVDAGQFFDIDLGNEQGEVCVKLKGFTTRSVKRQNLAELVAFKPVWIESSTAAVNETYEQQLVILCEPGEYDKDELALHLKDSHIYVLQSSQPAIEQRFESYTIQVFEEIKNILKSRPLGKILVQLILKNEDTQLLFNGLQGLLRTAHAENPLFTGQCIVIEDMKGIVYKIKYNRQYPDDFSIRYHGEKRELMSWVEMDFSGLGIQKPWKDNGVYLITGGAGSLGFIFADEIKQHAKQVKIILAGKSPLEGNKKIQLLELVDAGVQAEYRQVDISSQESVNVLIAEIISSFGKLNGIIHSAGLIRDNYILKKGSAELQTVLAPKVAGLVHLDLASQDLELDFFVLFSSITGSLGNVGQADYSAANAFMDAYAVYRNRLLSSKKRHGQTLSINWPLWAEGSMKPDPATREIIQADLGMMPMSTADGIHAFYYGLASGLDQLMIIAGDAVQIRKVITGKVDKGDVVILQTPEPEISSSVSVDRDLLEQKTIAYLKQLISSVIKTPVSQIDAAAAMEKYGIDSVLVIQLTHQLEKVFGSLSKTLFFEYQSIRELSGYFIQVYRERILALLEIEEVTTNPGISVANPVPVLPLINDGQRKRFGTVVASSSKNKPATAFDIAVVGLAGKYAGAQTVTEFWNNLKEGKNSITEIPADRWDWKTYYNPQRGKKGTSYTKWGGFIKDIDKFDPLFFHISPVDAEKMDPQERLFVETAYSSIEDAGYTPENLSVNHKVGVFVGVMHGLYSSESGFWSIANRVSYLFNFQGPSLAVDTACSSSLTALHLAIESLHAGSCDCAIAGGVNLIVDPAQYVSLSEMTMVSSTGSCKSFGAGADGFVDGEGVGSVILKPLSQAIADGDHIYGVIKGSTINHGGKTNGYTVPNPQAQASLISEALKIADVDASSISYLEAHGTGTALGDPIEIAGLSKAFGIHTQKKQFCAIGSAKSNIGHCESAAGIAALTKVLLQFKYQQLVPSLHSKELNPNIDFKQTPFVVQQELAEWKQPLIDGVTKPRRAGISSFGAGGANAHLILEEYITPAIAVEKRIHPVLIVLSAGNKDQLDEQVLQLLLALEGNIPLLSLAYTLQTGRRAMQERIAMQVESIDELREKLSGYLSADQGQFYQGQVNANKQVLSLFEGDTDLQLAIDRWIEHEKYDKLLEWWVKGLVVNWRKIYGANLPLKISLPTYPFARERYWLSKAPRSTFQLQTEEKKETASLLLIEQVIDDLLHERIAISAAAEIINEC